MLYANLFLSQRGSECLNYSDQPGLGKDVKISVFREIVYGIIGLAIKSTLEEMLLYLWSMGNFLVCYFAIEKCLFHKFY